MSGEFGYYDIPSRRCDETRAHNAHRYTRSGLYTDCPGGPAEANAVLDLQRLKAAIRDDALEEAALMLDRLWDEYSQPHPFALDALDVAATRVRALKGNPQ